MDLCHIAKIGIYKWSCDHIGLKLTAIDNEGKALKDLDDIKEYFAIEPTGSFLSLESAFIKDYTKERSIYTTYKQRANITILHNIAAVLENNTSRSLNDLKDTSPTAIIKTINYNNETYSALSENTKQLLQRAENQISKYNASTNYAEKSNIINSPDVDQICKDCKNLLEDYKKKGIKVTKKPKLNNCRSIVKSPIDKYYIFPGGGMYKKDNIRQWFGLKLNNIRDTATAYESNENPIHRGIGKAYFKGYSRYHNCAGYVRYLLEGTGIRAFKDTSHLERFGVTDPAKFKTYIEDINKKIYTLNIKAHVIFENIIQASTTSTPNMSIVNDELNKHQLLPNINKFHRSDLDTKIKILISSVDYIHNHYTSFSKDTREYIMNLIISTYSTNI